MTELLDRIRGALVGLKMPRALEALDHTMQRLEQGKINWIEALDALLSEEYATRETRRIDVALRTAKLLPAVARPRADRRACPARLHSPRRGRALPRSEAWKLVPAEARDYIREKFREDGLMVRRDMVDNSVGYRSMSMGDPWTRISELDAPSRKAFANAATVVLGKNAFKRLTQAEKGWQAGISVAKNTFVIRSVIVPASNLASNFIHPMTLGAGCGRAGYRPGLLVEAH